MWGATTGGWFVAIASVDPWGISLRWWLLALVAGISCVLAGAAEGGRRRWIAISFWAVYVALLVVTTRCYLVARGGIVTVELVLPMLAVALVSFPVRAGVERRARNRSLGRGRTDGAG